MAGFPGPLALGRGIVVTDVSSAPAASASWRRVLLDAAALAAPAPLADELQRLWLGREPVVVELAVDPGALREAERCDSAPYTLSPGHEFSRERLQYLVWSNNYDGRSAEGPPIWWHARRAEQLGARPGTEGDVRLPDGTEAWCDGGARGSFPGGEDLVTIHRETIETGSLEPDRRAPVTSALAPDQLAAVAHYLGPARIIAPAGSGKTRVLTERLRHLLADRHVTSDSVLAVAFNKRAADELLERTRGLGAHIRTLNALGLAIVNGSRPFISSGEPTRRMINEREVREILQQLFTVRRQVNTDPWLAYLEALSAIRLGLADPEAVEEAIPDAAGIAEGFDNYREVLRERSVLDFDEQIYLAIERLLTDPELRRHAQRHARHLLVDEFQDLNPAHLLLIRLLAAPTYDVFGVGDDDQVIYSYAGATPEYLINYDRYFPGAVHYALERNYRCPPTVVEATRSLLSHNRRRVDKSIDSGPGRDAEAGQLRTEHEPAGRHATAALEVLQQWHAAGSGWGEIAALARVNSALLPLQVTLLEHQVPCTTPLGVDVLNRTGIRAALAYLRIGAEPGHIKRADIAETIRRPSRKIARNVAELLQRRPTTSLEGIRSLASALSGGDVGKVESYADDLELVARAVETGTTAAALRAIRTGVGLGSAMDVLDAAKRELDRSTHLDDLAALEQVAELHPDPATFEPWLRGMLAGTDEPEDSSALGRVMLSTVHRVKGQEWPHVLVLGASEDLFPHRLATDVEEERRIFHVAITRCSTDVVVMIDADRPSPFCAELSRVADRTDAPPATGWTSPEANGEAGLDRLRRRRLERATAPSTRVPRLERDGDGPDETLARALRDWRRATAERDAVPAYVVLSDAHLEGIAIARPSSAAELIACRGIGPAKLERYGEEILALIDASSEAPTITARTEPDK